MINDYLLEIRLNKIQNDQAEIKEQLNQLLKKENPGDELWDNSDMIRNWKVSSRTLSKWRKEGKIDFTKIGSKIFYSTEQRKKLLENYSLKNNYNGNNIK